VTKGDSLKTAGTVAVFLIIFDSSQDKALYIHIFTKFKATFKGHIVQEYARTLYGMRLISPLQNDIVAENNYSLFRVILSSSFEEEEKWVAARIAINGAYKWDTYLPWVEDPDDIFKFLTHNFAIQAKGEDGVAMQPIESMLKAIAYASNEKAREGLKKLDCTAKPFVNGIRKAFEGDRPFQTRKAALFLMPFIQDRWFDDSLEDVMSGEEKDEFCKNWASAVDGIDHTTDVKQAVCTTLFGMLNSNKWRSHIAKEKFKLMEYFADLLDDSKFFIACKENPSVLPWLRSGAGEGAEKAKLWLAILWSDYVSLPQDVRDQVLEMTKVVISKVRHDVSFISRIMAAEKERYQTKLDGYQAASLEDEAEKLRAKVEGLSESIEKFDEVVGKKAK
jgi:hypothetical protein